MACRYALSLQQLFAWRRAARRPVVDSASTPFLAPSTFKGLAISFEPLRHLVKGALVDATAAMSTRPARRQSRFHPSATLPRAWPVPRDGMSNAPLLGRWTGLQAPRLRKACSQAVIDPSAAALAFTLPFERISLHLARSVAISLEDRPVGGAAFT